MLISCIGDSLTAGDFYYGDVPGPMCYQYWIKDFLNEKNNDYDIYFNNYGVPGAVSSQIERQISNIDSSDYLIIMSGTNDVWMFSSDTVPEQNHECIEDVLKKIETMVIQAKSKKIKKIILCSIPPVKIGTAASKGMHENILKINKKISIIASKFGILFSDVYKNMGKSAENQSEMDERNFKEEGVHFTQRGNKMCGYAIAQVIHKNECD